MAVVGAGAGRSCGKVVDKQGHEQQRHQRPTDQQATPRLTLRVGWRRRRGNRWRTLVDVDRLCHNFVAPNEIRTGRSIAGDIGTAAGVGLLGGWERWISWGWWVHGWLEMNFRLLAKVASGGSQSRRWCFCYSFCTPMLRVIGKSRMTPAFRGRPSENLVCASYCGPSPER